jgi:hypothetical protein
LQSPYLCGHHAFFTTADPQVAGTVAAAETRRAHAIIEQVHADLRTPPWLTCPSASSPANAAWLVLGRVAKGSW